MNLNGLLPWMLLLLACVGCQPGSEPVEWITPSVSVPLPKASIRHPEDAPFLVKGTGSVHSVGTFHPFKGETSVSGQFITSALGREFRASFDGAETIFRDVEMTQRESGGYRLASGEVAIPRWVLLISSPKEFYGHDLWVPNRFRVEPLDGDYVVIHLERPDDGLTMIQDAERAWSFTTSWPGTKLRYKGREFERKPDGWYSGERKLVVTADKGYFLEAR